MPRLGHGAPAGGPAHRHLLGQLRCAETQERCGKTPLTRRPIVPPTWPLTLGPFTSEGTSRPLFSPTLLRDRRIPFPGLPGPAPEISAPPVPLSADVLLALPDDVDLASIAGGPAS